MERFPNSFKCNFITFGDRFARGRALSWEAMSDSSTLELLAWISTRPRTYAEAMEAWRSTCPRQSSWEDALVERLIEIVECGDTIDQSQVALTERGRARLKGQP